MDENATKITEWVKNKSSDFNERFVRMDADFELWDLEEAVDDQNLRKKTKYHETDINIVPNKPRTFADKVQAKLSAAEMQVMVRMAEAEGEDKRDDIGKLERLFYFALEKADERLSRMLLPPLRDSLIWDGMVRGWMDVRILVYRSGKNVVFDFLRLDPRWVVYEVGSDGLMKVGYTTFRSGLSLKDEYGIDAKKERDNTVTDYWEYKEDGKIENSVVADNDFLKKPELLNLPSMPILIMPVATRPPVVDLSTHKVKGYGDSIFAPNRQIYAIQNRLASMWATHANLLARQPTINYYDDKGKILKTTAFLADAVLNLPKDHNKIEAAPMKEISPTLVNLVSFIGQMESEGSLPEIDVSSPPPSGTLYNLVQEASNKVFNPQLMLLDNMYAGICRLIEEQLLVGGVGTKKIRGGVKVQRGDKQKYYEEQVTATDLKRPHIINVEFTATTPWSQLDTTQVAQMLKQLGLPDEWIWENILKVQDPKGLADLAAIELFEKSPKGAMKKAVEALVRTRGDVVAAQSLVDDMDLLEEQERGVVPPPQGV